MLALFVLTTIPLTYYVGKVQLFITRIGKRHLLQVFVLINDSKDLGIS